MTKRQTNSVRHVCPRKGCKALVGAEFFACFRDWHRLSPEIRREILGAHVPGQTAATASPAWHAAAKRAIAFWEGLDKLTRKPVTEQAYRGDT